MREHGARLASAPENVKADKDCVLAAVNQCGGLLRIAVLPLKANREVVLAAVQQDGHALQHAAEALKEDRAIVMTAVERCGMALRHAAESLKADHEVVMAAVKQDGHAFQYAGASMRGSPQAVMEAVRLGGVAFQHVDDELKTAELRRAAAEFGYWLKDADDDLKADRSLLLAAVSKSGTELSNALDRFRADREIVMAAVKQDGSALQYASEELCADREIVMAAVRQDGSALAHASSELRADREIVMAAVKQAGRALEYAAHASSELCADREIVMAAVKQAGRALEYASEELCADREVVMAAVRQHGIALSQASVQYCGDREVVIAAAETHAVLSTLTCAMGLTQAAASLKVDREVVLMSVRQNGRELRHAGDAVKQDGEIVMEAVRQNGSALAYALEPQRADREIVMAAVEQTGHALEYASSELHADREIVMAAVEQTGSALAHASEELRADHQIVMAAVRRVGFALEYASVELRAVRDIVAAAVRQVGFALRYASEQLRAHRHVVHLAVRHCPTVIQWAAHPFRADVGFMLSLVRRECGVLQFADESIKADPVFVEAATREVINQDAIQPTVPVLSKMLEVHGRRALSGMLAAGLPAALLQAMMAGKTDVSQSSKLLQDLMGNRFQPRERKLLSGALAAVGAADPFASTELTTLVALLRTAHAEGKGASATLAAKALCSRVPKGKGQGAKYGSVWPLVLAYLLPLADRPLNAKCLYNMLALPSSPAMPSPSDFSSAAFTHLLMHLPSDVFVATATSLTLRLVINDLSAVAQVVSTAWQHAPSSSEPLIRLRCSVRKHQTFYSAHVEAAAGAAPNGVVGSWCLKCTRDGGDTILVSPITQCISIHSSTAIKIQLPRAMVEAGRPLTLMGSFEMVAHHRQYDLLAQYHTAVRRRTRPEAAAPNAVETLMFAASGKLASGESVSTEAAALCRQVALRYVAHHFTSLSATAEFRMLPSELVKDLLHLDELSTDSEEHTLVALTPWLEDPARDAACIVTALDGIRWAWLPLEVVLKLRKGNGVLHRFAHDNGLRHMIDGAVALICSSGKRAREEDVDLLTCPIT